MIRKCSPILLVLILCIIGTGCGSSSSPSTPTPVITFTGNYSGIYQIDSCSDGALTGFCAGTGFNVGTRLPITMSLGQNATSVSGNVALGSITGNFQGTAQGSNLSGSATMQSLTFDGIQVLTTIITWNSSLSGNGMSGNFTVTFTIVGLNGNAGVTASLVSLTR